MRLRLPRSSSKRHAERGSRCRRHAPARARMRRRPRTCRGSCRDTAGRIGVCADEPVARPPRVTTFRLNSRGGLQGSRRLDARLHRQSRVSRSRGDTYASWRSMSQRRSNRRHSDTRIGRPPSVSRAWRSASGRPPGAIASAPSGERPPRARDEQSPVAAVLVGRRGAIRPGGHSRRRRVQVGRGDRRGSSGKESLSWDPRMAAGGQRVLASEPPC